MIRIVHNGWVYVQIQKGMYSTPQSGMFAHIKLSKILKQANFQQAEQEPGLWTYKTCTHLAFFLVIDDFREKYTRQEDTDFLCNTLINDNYEITTNWGGILFCGITIQWDNPNHKYCLFIPGYIKAFLLRFHHNAPLYPKYQPATHVPQMC